MCQPSSWETLTAKERLMEMEQIREHHTALGNAIYRARNNAAARDLAVAAYNAHTAEHQAAAQRMRVAREERVK